jgi:predicted nucleic acid-binding protein
VATIGRAPVPVLVDSNVLIDVVEGDSHWVAWSKTALEDVVSNDQAVINPIVYAELAADFPNVEAVDRLIAAIPAELKEIPRPALFLASQAFAAYRQLGGKRTGVLSDFFIGAHAAVSNWPLLTRDIGRYRTYFPTVTLIAP